MCATTQSCSMPIQIICHLTRGTSTLQLPFAQNVKTVHFAPTGTGVFERVPEKWKVRLVGTTPYGGGRKTTYIGIRRSGIGWKNLIALVRLLLASLIRGTESTIIFCPDTSVPRPTLFRLRPCGSMHGRLLAVLRYRQLLMRCAYLGIARNMW